MSAGSFRDVLTIKSIGRSQRADGGYDTTPATLATVRGAVKAVRASEYVQAGRLVKNGATYVITTYRRDDVTTDMYVIWDSAGSIELNIREVRFPPERSTHMEIVAERGVVR